MEYIRSIKNSLLSEALLHWGCSSQNEKYYSVHCSVLYLLFYQGMVRLRKDLKNNPELMHWKRLLVKGVILGHGSSPPQSCLYCWLHNQGDPLGTYNWCPDAASIFLSFFRSLFFFLEKIKWIEERLDPDGLTPFPSFVCLEFLLEYLGDLSVSIASLVHQYAQSGTNYLYCEIVPS